MMQPTTGSNFLCILYLSLLKFGGAVNDLPDFHFEGGDTLEDHYRLGSAMGVAYGDAIRRRVQTDVQPLTKFLLSPKGQKVLSEFQSTHQKLVPELVQEMKGIANGSGVPFDKLFAVSLKEELGYFQGNNSDAFLQDNHCSDYMLCTETHCIDGHNEDGELPDRHLFVAFVRLGEANFTVLNYAGDLLGGMSAMAFNAAGLAFSLNYVAPGQCTTDGLGRNFVSRLLLGAKNWEDALRVLSKKHASGHNYQLMDFGARRIANIEVANAVYSVREISTPFFHANKYQTLNIPGEHWNNSTTHRLARVKQLPTPRNSVDVLRILGDQGDRSYPIFHDTHSHNQGDLSDWTLASVLFDLDRHTVSVMDGNPAKLKVKRQFSVPSRARTTWADVMV